MATNPEHYPAKKKKKEEGRGVRTIRTIPTEFEAGILKKFRKITGLKVQYHAPIEGMKIKEYEQSDKKDPVPTSFDIDVNGRPTKGFKDRWLASTGTINLKPGIFTPDGQFTHEGIDYSLEIKSHVDMENHIFKLLDLLEKYASDRPFIILSGSVGLPKANKQIPKVNLLDNELLPAYLIDRNIRDKETGEWKKAPIYIVDWSRVLQLIEKDKPIKRGVKRDETSAGN